MKVVRTWNVLGVLAPVVWGDIDGELEGEYDSLKGEIRVSSDVEPPCFWAVESHELGHRVAHVMGMRRMLQDVFGLSAEVASKIEEEWVSKFLPVYLDTLQRNGYLTTPIPPESDK